jgi:hypothetical protein
VAAAGALPLAALLPPLLPPDLSLSPTPAAMSVTAATAAPAMSGRLDLPPPLPPLLLLLPAGRLTAAGGEACCAACTASATMAAASSPACCVAPCTSEMAADAASVAGTGAAWPMAGV